MARGEKTVVIAGVACIEQLGDSVFVMAQVAVDEVDAQVEEHQGQGDGQPFPGLNVLGAAPGQEDAGQTVEQYKTGMQPRVIAWVDSGTVAFAKGLGGMGHGVARCIFCW